MAKGLTVKINKLIPVTEAVWDTGLTKKQAEERLENGYGNEGVNPPSKTVGQIFIDNIFTYFNLVFCILGLCVLAVGSYIDLTFMPVVIANTAIGIVQELRSKRVVDKLSLISEPKANVIRDGMEVSVSAEKAVRDDVAVFRAGNQIYADAVVIHGECQVNEALITGEADEIAKKPGDTLLSGSFLVSGECRVRLINVGAESFVSRLTIEAKKAGKKSRSEMMNALTKLVKYIGIIIFPVGLLMFLQSAFRLHETVKDSVVTTVAALVGMIPEGLYLLTSIALTISVMRLAMKKTLVHDLGSIETLARVDILCVDKTGTITENKMIVNDIALLCAERFVEDDIRLIMSDYAGNMAADNETMVAVKKYFNGEITQRAVKTMPFSSKYKYSGVSYAEDETYVLGAPELILGESYKYHREKVEEYSALGCRVLLLALYDGDIAIPGINAPVMPLALILLTNKIRAEAPDTFKFFAEQGVSIKVISGDNPLTVSRVAVEAGIAGAENYVDALTLTTERKIQKAIKECTVFGRVTPEQKRKLIKALKAEGHTVAMTGDGVNDILALKAADCSIAMASGSDVACHVSQLVLLDSNFASLPSVVMEGRRVINNIERSASLYIVKNIFSFLMAFITLFIAVTYPITPSQISLISITTIGIPSFILAMEPNSGLIRGRFLMNVVLRAIPAGLTDVFLILGAVLLSDVLGLSNDMLSTIVAVTMGAVGFAMIFSVSRPFNTIRRVLLISMIALFVLGAVFLPQIFSLVAQNTEGWLLMAALVILALPLMTLLSWVQRGIIRIITKK